MLPTSSGMTEREEAIVKKLEVQLKGINLCDNEDGGIATNVCNVV